VKFGLFWNRFQECMGKGFSKLLVANAIIFLQAKAGWFYWESDANSGEK